MSKSISVNVIQLEKIVKWMEFNGVNSLSVAYAILVKRGLDTPFPKTSKGIKGGGLSSQKKRDSIGVLLNAE